MFAFFNAVLTTYAIVAYIGIRNSVADVVLGALQWVQVPTREARAETAARRRTGCRLGGSAVLRAGDKRRSHRCPVDGARTRFEGDERAAGSWSSSRSARAVDTGSERSQERCEATGMSAARVKQTESLLFASGLPGRHPGDGCRGPLDHGPGLAVALPEALGFAGYVDVTATPTYQFGSASRFAAEQCVIPPSSLRQENPCRADVGYLLLDGRCRHAARPDAGSPSCAASGRCLGLVCGQINDELAVVVATLMPLTDAYASVVTGTSLSSIDLDIEGPALADTPPWSAGHRQSPLCRPKWLQGS